MSGLKLVLFDCDGTLANSEAFLTRVAVECFSEAGVAHLLEDYRADFFSMTFSGFFHKISPHLSAETSQQLQSRFLATIRAERNSGKMVEPFYPGMLEILEQLNADGYLLGVATNKGSHGLASVLTSNKAAHLFTTLHHSDNSAHKPAPDMVLKAMGATGVDQRNCIMVGDTMADILMSRNAGVPCIGAQWGPQHDLEGAACLLERVEDLPAALARQLP